MYLGHDALRRPAGSQMARPPLALNASHPLARNLVLLVPGWGVDVISGRRLSLMSMTAYTANRYHGSMSVESTSTTAGGAWVAPSKSFFDITTEYSVGVLCAMDSAANHGALLAVPYRDDASWSTPFKSISFKRKQALTNATAERAIAGGPYGATTPTGYLLLDGSDHLYSYSAYGTDNVDFYRDGVLFDSSTMNGSGPVDWGDHSPVHTMQRSRYTSGEGIDGRAHLIAVWSRPLSARDWAWFASPPERARMVLQA